MQIKGIILIFIIFCEYDEYQNYLLGVRKSIQPIKKLSDEMLAWLSVRSEVQMICI